MDIKRQYYSRSSICSVKNFFLRSGILLERFIFIALFLPLASIPAISQDVDSVAYIKLEQFKVANITLGSSLKAAIKIFGKPDSIEAQPASIDTLEELVYYFNGVTVLISDDKVCRLECINPKYRIPQGLKVGDTIVKLFKAFGKAEIWEENGHRKAHYALWPPSNTYMIFHLHQNKITKIILEFLP